jgi:GTP pyrophosphokinase
MQDQHLTFDQLYDLTAFRIIVDSVQDCYGALGVLHSIFKAIPGRFKDYINLPKPNGYQSLHTAVIGPRNNRIEIQIRTKAMHDYAENGVAAHWRYKDDGALSQEETKRITALRSILSWQENLTNPDAFLNSVKESLADRESIYVFTPAGDPKELPAGASPVDFAYSIHTMVGNNCVGAKVNGAIVPLRHKLDNGDTVEILTDRNGVPSRDWLAFVTSLRAKARIRQWFAKEEKAQAVHFGHGLLATEMRRAGLAKSRLNNPEVMKSLGFDNLDEVNAAVGFGQFPVKKILQTMDPEKFKAAPPEPAAADPPPEGDEFSGDIRVSGLDDVFVRLAKCCSPLMGEPVIGYITQGRGVDVHSTSCHTLAGLDHDRLVSASWSGDQKRLFEVHLRVRGAPGRGVFAAVLSAVSQNVEHILEAHFSDNNTECSMLFRLSIRDQAQFAGLMQTVKRLSAVKHAERFFPD